MCTCPTACESEAGEVMQHMVGGREARPAPSRCHPCKYASVLLLHLIFIQVFGVQVTEHPGLYHCRLCYTHAHMNTCIPPQVDDHPHIPTPALSLPCLQADRPAPPDTRNELSQAAQYMQLYLYNCEGLAAAGEALLLGLELARRQRGAEVG